MISRSRLKDQDPIIDKLIQRETERKEFSLELIASENCVSEAVLEAQGSILTDKYAEGYPGRRYYCGCEFYDEIEQLAIDRLKKLFGVTEANVQPHSGSNANMAVFFAVLNMGDTILGPRLDHGGHLTHGSPVNFSGKYFKVASYGVNAETHRYEEEEVRRLALEHKPKMIICGASAYSRQIDFAMFRRIADEVGAVLMADVAHYAGLIAGGAYQTAVGHADIVTSTTHKTLRGPRGGVIMTDDRFIKKVNMTVFPGIQGGPLMHQIAAKAVAFEEALQPDFREYAQQVVSNARAMGETLQARGFKLLTGGTDSHMLIIDLRGSDINGKIAVEVLEQAGITTSKSTVPNDPHPPAITSGVRVGTAAITTRGFMETDCQEVAECIFEALERRDDPAKLAQTRERVRALCKRRPLFPHRLPA